MTDANDAELVQLHERLLAGDPTAPVALTERLLPLLQGRLRGLGRSIDDSHILPSAVGLVLAGYLQTPERFDPTRGGLVAFLAMQVRGDVLNELDARRRRRRRESPVAVPVELVASARDPTVEEALDAVDPFDVAPSAIQAARQALGEFSAVDLRLLEMMAEGVRATSAYAAVLEISHLPDDLQRKIVKRHKDRLQKRLERLRGRLT